MHDCEATARRVIKEGIGKIGMESRAGVGRIDVERVRLPRVEQKKGRNFKL